MFSLIELTLCISQTTPGGCPKANRGSHRHDYRKMQEKQTKIMHRTRRYFSYSIDQILIALSPLQGLKMAIMDPIVVLFAIMTISQLLGLSFVNFFPT